MYRKADHIDLGGYGGLDALRAGSDHPELAKWIDCMQARFAALEARAADHEAASKVHIGRITAAECVIDDLREQLALAHVEIRLHVRERRTLEAGLRSLGQQSSGESGDDASADFDHAFADFVRTCDGRLASGSYGQTGLEPSQDPTDISSGVDMDLVAGARWVDRGLQLMWSAGLARLGDVLGRISGVKTDTFDQYAEHQIP